MNFDNLSKLLSWMFFFLHYVHYGDCKLPDFFTKDPFLSIGFGFEVLPPPRVIAIQNSTIFIKCEGSHKSQSDVSVDWSNHMGRIINDRFTVNDRGWLTINKVERADNGTYWCLLSSGDEVITSNPVIIHVLDPLMFSLPVEILSIQRSFSVRLSCFEQEEILAILNLAKDLRVTWQKDGTPVATIDRFYSLHPQILQIWNSTNEDHGSYSCHVNFNSNYTALVRSIKLYVTEESPLQSFNNGNEHNKSHKSPSNVIVFRGESAVLECMASTSQEGNYKWTRIGDHQVSPRAKLDAFSNLILKSAAFSDTGEYQCSNSNGGEYEIKNLLVLQTPAINSFTGNSHVANGFTARINCSSSTILATDQLLLLKDGVPISSAGSSDRILSRGRLMGEMKQNGTFLGLYIPNVRPRDQGIYQCFAIINGIAVSQLLRLIVISPSRNPDEPSNLMVEDSGPTFIQYKWDRPIYAGPNISKVLEGFITYFGFTDSDIKQQKLVSMNVTEMLYGNLEPCTNYTFSIRTIIIQNEATFPLMSDPTLNIFHFTSPAPYKTMPLHFKMISPYLLNVEWSLPPWKDLQGYYTFFKIMWRIVSGKRVYSLAQLSESTQANISVIPSTHYLLKLYPAGNDLGDNIQIVWTHFWTPPEPETNRVHLTLTSNKTTEIIAEWLNPYEENQNKNLKISLTLKRLDKVREDFVTEIDYCDDKNSFIFSDLDPGCYKIMGEMNGKQYLIQKDNASICTIFCNSLTADVKTLQGFYKPFCDSIPYIELNRLISSLSSLTSISVTNVTSTTLSLNCILTPEEKPDFFIVLFDELVTNSYQNRKERDVDVLHTKNNNHELQNRNLIFDLNEKENKQNLNRDKNHRSNIYNTLYKEDTNSSLSSTHIADLFEQVLESRQVMFTSDSITVWNLKPMTKYRISVISALNDGNVGLPLKPIFIQTAEGVPTKPLSLTWYPKTASSIKVSWVHPISMNGKLKIYRLRFFKWNETAVKKEVFAVPDINTLVVTGLVSNVEYKLHLSASTDVGYGEEVVTTVLIKAVLAQDPLLHNIVIAGIAISTAMLIACLICHCIRIVKGRIPKEKIINDISPKNGLFLQPDYSEIMANNDMDSKGKSYMMDETQMVLIIQHSIDRDFEEEPSSERENTC